MRLSEPVIWFVMLWVAGTLWLYRLTMVFCFFLAFSRYVGAIATAKMFTHQYTGPYPGYAAWPSTAGECPNPSIKWKSS